MQSFSLLLIYILVMELCPAKQLYVLPRDIIRKLKFGDSPQGMNLTTHCKEPIKSVGFKENQCILSQCIVWHNAISQLLSPPPALKRSLCFTWLSFEETLNDYNSYDVTRYLFQLENFSSEYLTRLIGHLLVSSRKKTKFFIHFKFDYEIINMCVETGESVCENINSYQTFSKCPLS